MSRKRGTCKWLYYGVLRSQREELTKFSARESTDWTTRFQIKRTAKVRDINVGSGVPAVQGDETLTAGCSVSYCVGVFAHYRLNDSRADSTS